MPKHNLPVYAIVELLMLLAQHDRSIGDYRGHTIRDQRVVVKTSGGSITFPLALIMRQFSDPDSINKRELMNLASFFRPKRVRQRSA
jgi:hypothetical protein